MFGSIKKNESMENYFWPTEKKKKKKDLFLEIV